MARLEIKGLDKLEKSLKAGVTMDHVKKLIRLQGGELKENMMRKAEFSRGYQTGTTRRSITSEYASDGLSVSVGPTTEYSPYVEYGTRFMAAQPFVRPALKEQKVIFLKHLKLMMK